MARAASENPSATDKKVKIYGMRLEVYIPHFFLGLARYHQGDCQGALAAWEISLSYGVVQSTSWSSELNRLRAECLAAAPPPAAPTPTVVPLATAPPIPAGADSAQLHEAIDRAEREIRAADSAQQKVLFLRSDDDLAGLWLNNRQLVTDHEQAASLLEQAKARFTSGRDQSDLELLARAESLAVQARQALEAIPGKVETARRAELTLLAERERRQTEASPTPVPRSRPTRVLVQPTAPPTVNPVIPTPAVGRPAALVNGVQAYLEADFQQAVEVLEGQRFSTRRAAAVADLVRGASIWLLYLEGGEKEPALRGRAVEAVLACKQLDASVVPHPEFFAPSFVRFFSEVD
jgi:hypothetical protein